MSETDVEGASATVDDTDATDTVGDMGATTPVADRAWVVARSRLFGDRTGIALFLGALVFYGLVWRVGFFMNDEITVATVLANLVEGNLHLAESPYVLTPGGLPGAVEVDGLAYGRNYGHALLALPLVWLLEGAARLVDPRVFLAALWTLLAVGFSWHLGRLLERPGVGAAGSAIALVVFLANLALARPLPAAEFPVVALGASTLLLAAIGAVATYRLLARFHGPRVGAAAGAAFVLATPVSVWATIPKRHALTASVMVLTLYWFAVSREDPDRWGLLARAAAYATLALLATVHAFEAVFLLLVFAPLDVLTAPDRRPQTTVLLGLVLFVALLPLFVINTLISGNPLQPPRLLDGLPLDFAPEDPAGGVPADGAGIPTATGDDVPLTGAFGAALSSLDQVVALVLGSLLDGLRAATDPRRLYHTFVRSGWIPGFRYDLVQYETIDLALLEAFPLAAALAWLPVAAGRRVRYAVPDGVRSVLPRRPAGQTDLLAGGYAVVFTLVYLPHLPLHISVTVRYILPVAPLLCYAVVRIPPVNRSIHEHPRVLVAGYLGFTAALGAAFVVTVPALGLAVGEAMQLHALVGLATAVPLVVAVGGWPLHRNERAVALSLGAAAAATTVLILLSGLFYFQFGPYALDVVETLADTVVLL